MLRVLTIWHLAVSGVCCAVFLVPTLIASARARKRLRIKEKIFAHIMRAIRSTICGCFFLAPYWNVAVALRFIFSYAKTEKGMIAALEEKYIKKYSEHESE